MVSTDHGGLDKRAALAQHRFFRDLPSPILDRLAAHARLMLYAEGDKIFAKGDPGLGLMAVVSGVVKVSVPSDEGKEIVLNLIRADEIFGEIALLDGQARSADAWALLDTRLIAIDRRDFLQILRDEPSLAVRLLAVISDRLRRTSQQVEDLSFVDREVRLAKSILRLAEVQGVLGQERPRVKITQKELGQTIGLSRENTNRQLREWAGEGLIALEKGGLQICRLSQLLRLAERHTAP